MRARRERSHGGATLKFFEKPMLNRPQRRPHRRWEPGEDEDEDEDEGEATPAEVHATEGHLLHVACTRARDHLLRTATHPPCEPRTT